jgi:hypothetical protein
VTGTTDGATVADRRRRGVMSTSLLCPLLELDRSLSPYYWLNVGDRDMRFGSVIEQTNFLSPTLHVRKTERRLHLQLLSVLPDDPK